MSDTQDKFINDITAIARPATALEDQWAMPALDALRSEIRKMKRILVAVFMPPCLVISALIFILGERDVVVYSVGAFLGVFGLAVPVVVLREGAKARLLELVPSSNKVLSVRIPVEEAWHITPEHGEYKIVLIRTPGGRHLSIGGEGYLADGTAAGGVFPGQELIFVHYFLDRTTKKVPPIIEGVQSLQLAVCTEGVARPLPKMAAAELPKEHLELGYSPSNLIANQNGSTYLMPQSRMGSLTQEDVLELFSIDEVQQECK